jgi:hypothetical protein
MKYDDLIASANSPWPPSTPSRALDLYKRVAQYIVDGTRAGTVDWPADRLDRPLNEIQGVILIFGLLEYERVRITSLDQAGNKLEHPDLDVSLSDGTLLGLEQAEVTNMSLGKHESEADKIAVFVRGLLANDPSFAQAFGSHHVLIFLSSHAVGKHTIQSRKERLQITSELERFIRSREHASGKAQGTFSSRYPCLASRGATWGASHRLIPVFDLGHGTTNPSTVSMVPDVIRILNKHRDAAKNYRNLPLWLMMNLTDRWNFTRKTLDNLCSERLDIEPFERCYVADDEGHVLEVRKGGSFAFTGMFAE